VEKVTFKHEQLLAALERMEEAIIHLERVEKNEFQIPGLSQEELCRSMRDSCIQRFEFCADQFWKYLKLFLDEKLKQKIKFNAPSAVIRAACQAKMISEADTKIFLEMMDDRNMSSHIYKEEVAEKISAHTAGYHKLMHHYTQQLSPTSV
jgi:nucleotidyltransferase substrate binding protein (TIGR01987 family)